MTRGLSYVDKPHRLRLVELGILKRRQAKQPVSETRMQSFLGDVDLIAENQLQRLQAVRRRSAAPCGAATAGLSTARRLHRPAAAAARRGCDHGVRPPGRSLRPALGRSCARSRETPTGRPTARGGHRGRRCCPARAVPSAAARRSGCRILPAASCPDSERGGRTNPGRCPGAPPSSRSGRATRAVAPARPEWPPRRRTRRARLARSVTARGRPEGSGGDTLRERPRHPRASPALSKSTARKKHVSSRSSG